MKYKIGLATTDGKVIDEHFGRASFFAVVEVDAESGAYEFLGKRPVAPLCVDFSHDESRIDSTAELLSDLSYVLVARIGPPMRAALAEKGVQVIEAPEIIPDAIEKCNRFYRTQQQVLR